MIELIMLGLTMLELLLAFYCLIQWRKWENAYWNLRGHRDPEMTKKTIVMPYKFPKSKHND